MQKHLQDKIQKKKVTKKKEEEKKKRRRRRRRGRRRRRRSGLKEGLYNRVGALVLWFSEVGSSLSV
jgi:hypothetical protein